MPKQTTFAVSKRGIEPVKVNFIEPESLEDPRWGELGVEPAGINELATQSLVIKIQAGARNQLDKGPKEVQNFVDGYKYGQRIGGGVRKVTLKAEQIKQAKFSPEQLAMLKAAGVSIPGTEDETPAEAEKPKAATPAGTSAK